MLIVISSMNGVLFFSIVNLKYWIPPNGYQFQYPDSGKATIFYTPGNFQCNEPNSLS